MTIVASVKVRDGLVLGTDSMTQIIGSDAEGQLIFVKSYKHARKLFELTPHRAGVMTWGLGNIGDHSIEGLVREVRPSLDDGLTVGEITAKFFEFIQPRWQDAVAAADNPAVFQLGFCVAGYSPDAHFAELHEFELPRDSEPTVASAQETFGLQWRGIDSPLIRLVKGWDPRILHSLAEAGFDAEKILSILGPLEWFFSQPGMPLQEAINLVEFLLSTTAGVSAFVDTNPTCGGPLQIATILPDRGFTWITRRELSLPKQEHIE